MSNSDNNEEVTQSSEFGLPLRKARESEKYSVEEIADILKVPVQVIHAIEASELEQLPPATFTRGYLRAYARYVEIADTDVLAAYERAVPQKEHLKPRSSLPGEPSSQSPLIKTVTMIVIAFVVLALIYTGYQYYNEKASSMKASMQSRVDQHAGEVSSLDAPKTLPAVEQKARLNDEGELVLDIKPRVTESAIEPSSTALPVEEKTTTTSGAEVTNKTETRTKTNNTTKTPADKSLDSIALRAKKGAWVEIRDASDKRLHYNMIPKGKWVSFKGQAPFEVSMGNARSTSLKVNGLAIDVSDYIRPNNIAQFRVSTTERDGQQVVVFH